MTGRLQSIPLGCIITSPRLQNRNAAAPCLQHRLPLTPATLDHLDSLKHAIKRGVELPPVKLIRAECDKPGLFYLVDGYHRYWAYQGLNLEEIPATVLEGQGFAAALIEAGKANHNHGLLLTKDQKVESAWRCLNLPETDYYRRMNKTLAEAELGVDRETIKKMRQKVRQRGVTAGAIDPSLRGKAAEEALLSYWNDNPAPDTWRMARRDGSTERKNPHWQEKKAARALAQVLADFEAAYGADVAKKAINAVGFHLHNVKPAEGMTKVRRAFSVSAQPIPDEDEATLSAEEMAAFLDWQREQAFDFQPQPHFNDTEHHLPADF
jgi:ParB-like chromosome segregation protein Spo0J